MEDIYAKRFTLPADFPDLLKDFTREILREQTNLTKKGQNETLSLDDMYSLGEKYFAEQLSSLKGPSGDGSTDEDISEEQEQLRGAIAQCFEDADENGDKTLSRREFIQLFKTHPIFEPLGLQNKDIRRVLANADENEDGNISYDEFLPLMLELFEALKAQKVISESKEHAYEEATLYVHGLDKARVEGILQQMFKEADLDNSGTLNRKELKKCLTESKIGLTKKEVQALLTEIDINNDGEVSYSEFAPLAYEIILELTADQMSGSTETAAELKGFLMDLFGGVDAEGTGEVSFTDLKSLLLSSDLGLSHIQIHSLLTIAPRKGKIVIEKLASDLAPVLEKMLDYQWQRETYEEEQKLRESEPTVYGMTEEEFINEIRGTIESFQGEESTLNGDTFAAALDEFISANKGTDEDFNPLMSLGYMNDDGSIDATECIEWGWETLFYLKNGRSLGLY
eukprot:g3997.t1